MNAVASPTTSPIYDRLLGFLARLDQHHVPYDLASVRRDTIMVQFALPGERWEVEFMTAGDIEVECFRGDGQIADESALDDLWRRLADDAER